MAFQTGTPVNPQLLNYSGYAQGMANAASIQAAALADLGARVGSTIEQHRIKEEEKELKRNTISSIGTVLTTHPNIAKALNLDKGAIDTGEVDENGNPIFTMKYDPKEVSTAATEVYNVLGQEGSTAFVGATYLKALEGGEEVTTGGLSDMENFRLEVTSNPDYKFQKKGGNTILTTRGPDGKFSEVGPNDPIFNMTDNPKAYYMFFTSDRANLY